MRFEKIKLPYPKSALEPYISEETMTYHYDKHHQAYQDNLNTLLVNEEAELRLEDLIKTSTGAIFNNAAQLWNHNHFWQIMSPKFDQLPTGPLLEKINHDFGSFDAFKDLFLKSALGNFGSGRTWLILTVDENLEILNTSNADNPLTKSQTAKILLGVDVWEHAYYIDTRNNRAQYLENFFHVINWELISKIYL